MSTPPNSPDSGQQSLRPPSWGRPLALATAVVFFISLVFPVAAALSHNTAAFPKWWGSLDVGLAFVLAVLAIAVFAVTGNRVTKDVETATYRAYRILIHGIFVLLVVFVFFGDRIVWINGLSGLGWRAWLLLYGLPAWMTALRATSHRGEASKP
jgi:hypothetical protein